MLKYSHLFIEQNIEFSTLGKPQMIEVDPTLTQPAHTIEKDVAPVECEPIMLERITVQNQAPIQSVPCTYTPPMEDTIIAPSKNENEATIPKQDIEVSERPINTRVNESLTASPTGKNIPNSSGHWVVEIT